MAPNSLGVIQELEEIYTVAGRSVADGLFVSLTLERYIRCPACYTSAAVLCYAGTAKEFALRYSRAVPLFVVVGFAVAAAVPDVCRLAQI